MALSEYDLDIYHVLGKDLAVADGLSRIEKYPSRIATDEESTMASFAAEVTTDYQSTAESPTRHPGDHMHRSEDVLVKAMTDRPLTAGRREDFGNGTSEQAEENTSWKLDWQEWLDDPWYGPIVEYLKTKSCNTRSILVKTEFKMTKQKAKKFVFIKNNEGGNELAFRERSGKLARRIYQS